MRLEGLGFRISGSVFRGWGWAMVPLAEGVRVEGFGFRVQGFRVQSLSLGFRVSGVGFVFILFQSLG